MRPNGIETGRMYQVKPAKPDAGSELWVYSGGAIPAELGNDIPGLARTVHQKLGEGKALGFMHQPDLDAIVQGMEAGGYAVTVRRVQGGSAPLLVASSHIRPAKSGPENRELGGVFAEQGLGHGIVAEGVLMGLEDGGESVEALVARTNPAGGFFRRIGGEQIGQRPSDYVPDPEAPLDPETGKPTKMQVMIIFDVTKVQFPHAA